MSYAFAAGGQRYRLVWSGDCARPDPARRAGGESARRSLGTARRGMIGLRNSVAPVARAGPSAGNRRDRRGGAARVADAAGLRQLGELVPRRARAGPAATVYRSQDLNTLELKVGEDAHRSRGFTGCPPARTARCSPCGRSASAGAAAGRRARRGAARPSPHAVDGADLPHRHGHAQQQRRLDALPDLPGHLGGRDAAAGRRAARSAGGGVPAALAGALVDRRARAMPRAGCCRTASSHDADDEYLQTGASALRGLGDYLRHSGDAGVVSARFGPYILRRRCACGAGPRLGRRRPDREPAPHGRERHRSNGAPAGST